MPSLLRFALPAGLLAFLLPGLMGCGGGSLPEPADPDQARTALQKALDTWQQGGSVEALPKGSPPIYFTDLNCRAGKKLVSYKIGEEHTYHGPSIRLSAVLVVQEDNGTPREKKAAYLIETSPNFVIVPDGM